MEQRSRGGSNHESPPRVSFSELIMESPSSSSSEEFEFRNPFSSIGEEEEDFSGRFPADELFYNGTMLPLEPISRMAMVRDLNTVIRRGPGSAPPSPYFDPASRAPGTTRKSSSYPPSGRGSRRFKDFFVGLKKNPQEAALSKPSSVSSSSSSSSSGSSSSGKFLRNVLNFRKKEGAKALNPLPKHQHQQHQQQQGALMVRRSRVVSATSGDFTRSAPATPMHPRAGGGGAGFAPVLHLPLPKFLSHKTIEVL